MIGLGGGSGGGTVNHCFCKVLNFSFAKHFGPHDFSVPFNFFFFPLKKLIGLLYDFLKGTSEYNIMLGVF